MQRKVISIYCLQKAGRLKVRIIEMQRLPQSATSINPIVASIFEPKTAFKDFFYQALALFNRLSTSSIDAHNLFNQFRESYRCEVVTNPDATRDSYAHNSLTIRLPTDEKQLLKVVGAIDSALHELAYHAPTGCEVHYHYHDVLPNNYNRATAISETFASHAPLYVKPGQPLSRYLAYWISTAVERDTQVLAEYQKVADTLRLLLKTDESSLTRIINDRLYPETSIDDFIENHCQKDRLMSNMLHSRVSYLQTTVELVRAIKETIAAKKNQGALTQWFAQFSRLRQQLWQQTVETLYGKAAALNGFYASNYTEIHLLLAANFTLNDRGQMVIDIRETKAYKEHYAPPKCGPSVLEVELRHACRLLGLEFLPNLNFHQEMIFDADSTRYLMNRGFHYSENYCKKLIRATHHMRLFQNSSEQEQSGTNYIRLLPLDLQTQIVSHEAEVTRAEVKASHSTKK
tara:strand:+ start:76 stop:1452 length:1377 start_codon:yes stop_codon:yes gene_type:complete